MANKTKIIATIGPASNKKVVLKKMVSAGMNVARLNFSHGSYEDHGKVIKRIRTISVEMKRPLGILLDLQGPKIRTGTLKDHTPVVLKRNQTFQISSRKISEGTEALVSTTYTRLPTDVKAGDRILLDDGLIELKVVSTSNHTVTTRVVNGGVLNEHKGINLPGVRLSTPALTRKDREDLKFGIQAGVDYVALSFVRRAEDIRNIKKLIKRLGADVPVIAKIEKPEALECLDDILTVADGIMIARGDLGVEMRPEQVPMIQKKMIEKAINANKPVITATQMLETMIRNPVPTRAEASDVANAIFDGTDAVMLSGETAVGKNPIKAVQMMARIAREAENSAFMNYNILRKREVKKEITKAVAQSAVSILNELDAKAIIVFSVSGKTSKLISKQRPNVPVCAFSPSKEVYHRLSLVWGITPLIIPEIKDTKQLIDKGEAIVRDIKMVRKDDLVVIITGLALKSGSTNMIKIHKVGERD